MNQIYLLGNLGNDPQVTTTSGGHFVCRFSMATTEYYGNEKRETTWHNIICWNKLGQAVAPMLRKGVRVFVKGKLTCREWEKDGQKRHAYEVVAEQCYPLMRDDNKQQQDGDRRPPPGSGGDDRF